MMATYQAFTAARVAVRDVLERARLLGQEHEAAKLAFEQADADLTRARGLLLLGEGDAATVEALVRRRDETDVTLRSVLAAVELLDQRMPVLQEAFDEAQRAFLRDARDQVQPEFERLRDQLFEQATALAQTLVRFAQVDVIANGIARGVRTGADLMRVAGHPFEVIGREHGVEFAPSFAKTPKRLTEAEILAVCALGAEAAARFAAE